MVSMESCVGGGSNGEGGGERAIEVRGSCISTVGCNGAGTMGDCGICGSIVEGAGTMGDCGIWEWLLGECKCFIVKGAGTIGDCGICDSIVEGAGTSGESGSNDKG
jgi:hypothetical protein